jgi:hypothetical protein
MGWEDSNIPLPDPAGQPFNRQPAHGMGGLSGWDAPRLLAFEKLVYLVK